MSGIDRSPHGGLARNVVDGGVAGPVVQAGTIHGGIHVVSAAAPVPTPRQLPGAPAHFVGREAELAEIDRQVEGDRDGPAVVVISGVGGVGKSALALAWAHRTRSRFPDGDIYADLGGVDPQGPVDPGVVLGEVLRALGVAAERVPATTAEQGALFRTMAADKRLLFLWDNAVSAAQVRPLLPPSATSAVLVTARWRLGGLLSAGGAFLNLDPLPDDAAARLVARAIGANRAATDPAATASLVRLCAGLPIALAVVSARLATRPRWPVRRMVNELAQENRRLHALTGQEGTSVRGAFDVSYGELPDPVARCYRAVGLHPGPEFGVPVVAAALDADIETAEELLDALVEASMLGETATGRFRQHDLVRLHARQHAEAEPDGPAIARRILEWYLAGTLAADEVLTPYRRRDPGNPFMELDRAAVTHPNRHAALEWLEAERPNLVAAAQRAASVAPLLAWKLIDAMWPLFHFRRHHHDRMLLDRVAVDCARRLGDDDREARAVQRWAFAHYDAGLLDEAAELFRRSRQLCEGIGDQFGVASAVEGLGVVARAQRRYADAMVYFGQQEKLYRTLGAHRNVGLALHKIGMLHNELGAHHEAAPRLREAAALFAGLGGTDPYNEARVHIELGRALAGSGDQARAKVRLTAALDTMRSLGSPRGEAEALYRLGELELRATEFPEARAHLVEAWGIYQRLGDTEAEQVRNLLDGLPPVEPDAEDVAQP